MVVEGLRWEMLEEKVFGENRRPQQDKCNCAKKQGCEGAECEVKSLS